MVDSRLDSLQARPVPRRRRRVLAWITLVLGLLAALPLAAGLAYRWVPPPGSMLMAIRWAQGSAIDYRWTPLEQISPHLAKAVVTAEDARFCEHRGVDWEVLNMIIDDPDGPNRGGSTIAMQTAKNLFLWPSRSYVRKAAELPLALWIDLIWHKRRVIEVYLNIVDWGPGIFGAEAAAQRHFGKPAAEISQGEAALLAATLPNPHERNAGAPGPGLRRLAAHIARRVPATTPHLHCLGS
jgi:monofunctional biosynthetic peptidoglycan transglycosylase